MSQSLGLYNALLTALVDARTMLVGLGIMLIYVVVAANCRKRAASAPLVHRDVAFEPDPVFTRAEMK